MWATPLAGDLVADETRTEDALRAMDRTDDAWAIAARRGRAWRALIDSPPDVRRAAKDGDGASALRLACEHDCLRAVRWLVDNFSLTAADARSRDNHALRLACANGHLDAGALAHRENSG